MIEANTSEVEQVENDDVGSDRVRAGPDPAPHPLWIAASDDIMATWARVRHMLMPFDDVFVLTFIHAQSLSCRHLWPKGRPPTGEQVKTVMAVALEAVATRMISPASAVASPAQSGSSLPHKYLDWLWKEFWFWHDNVLLAMLEGRGPNRARHHAIAVILKAYGDAGLIPRLWNGDHAQGVIKASRRKGRAYELGPHPERAITKEEVLSEMVAMDSFKSMIVDWDKEGRAVLYPNFLELFDRFVKNRRGKRGAGSLDGDFDDEQEEQPLSANLEDPDALRPPDAAAIAEAARLLRDLRDRCAERGPAAVAAFEHMVEKRTRAAAGEAHGVTPKQIRLAEEWVKAQAMDLTGWHEGS